MLKLLDVGWLFVEGKFTVVGCVGVGVFEMEVGEFAYFTIEVVIDLLLVVIVMRGGVGVHECLLLLIKMGQKSYINSRPYHNLTTSTTNRINHEISHTSPMYVHPT